MAVTFPNPSKMDRR